MTRQDQDRLAGRVDSLAEEFGVGEDDEPSLTEGERQAVFAVIQFRYLEWDTWADEVEGPPTEVEYHDSEFLDIALDHIAEEHAATLRGDGT